MKRVRRRVRHDERGTALILAIAFMLVIGAITGAVLSSVASGLSGRHALDGARNKEYGADGLIEYAIAQARTPVTSWGPGSPPSLTAFLASANSTGCGGPYSSTSVATTDPSQAQLDLIDGLRNSDGTVNYSIRVECTPAPTQTRLGFLQRNAIFTACLDTGAACTDASTIVRAQINFSDSGSTTVQAWSVNG